MMYTGLCVFHFSSEKPGTKYTAKIHACVFPSDWTTENLMKAHNSRPYNPDLAGTFYRAGYIEAWGGGTQKNCEKPLNAYMICFLYVSVQCQALKEAQ